MCTGHNCDGSALPVTYNFTAGGEQLQSVTVKMDPTVAPASYNVTRTWVVGGQIGGKLHNCPNCNCIQVTT